ncbi:MAG: sugar ABC transporter ATP-binding protein, partial [Planctomycetales bacterium]|nr:sugar ABC transporter ATP-binding protein [Planctomycetales bacterium]
LDEPTSSLTRKDIERLFTLIRRLKDQGHAIVYISHFLEEVQEISDTFTVLRDGQTVGGGVTGEVEIGQIINM